MSNENSFKYLQITAAPSFESNYKAFKKTKSSEFGERQVFGGE